MQVAISNIRVRYAETDQMGVVYYANFFVWFEIGRTDLLRQAGYNYHAMEQEDGLLLPAVDASCRYKAPARYDDELILETRILHLRTSVIKFGYRVRRVEAGSDPVSDHGKLLAEGETVHVLVNRAMQKTALPAKYIEPLRAYLHPVHEATP